MNTNLNYMIMIHSAYDLLIIKRFLVELLILEVFIHLTMN